MFEGTFTAVLESPRGDIERVTDVISIKTQGDGTISIHKDAVDGVVTRGWDWTIRDIYGEKHSEIDYSEFHN